MKNVKMGEFEELVMLAVVSLGDDAWLTRIEERLRQETRRRFPLGAIYTALMRLEEKNMVSSRLGEPTKKRGGRARRFFRVTQKGRTNLERSYRVRQRLWERAREMNPALGEA